MISLILTIAVALAFFLEGALHLYWAATDSLPVEAVLPHEDGLPLLEPEPAVTVATGVLMWVAELIVVLPGTYLKLGLAALLFLRSLGELHYIGFFKKVRGSRYARLDTWVYSPLCLVQAVAILWISQFP